MFFILFFIVFTNIGSLSKKITLSNELCNKFGQFSFVIYIVHWILIGFMTVFGKHNPTLLDQVWYLALYGIVCYAGSIGPTMATNALYKVVKNKILVKFKKINAI